MRFGIRVKFIFILVIAAVLPLLLGLTAVGIFGYHRFKNQRGELFKTMAVHLGSSLSRVTRDQIQDLHDWVILTDVAEKIAEAEKQRSDADRISNPEGIKEIEQRWPSLSADDEFLRNILENELSRHIRAYQKIHPLLVEVFITDRQGRLLAASNKTTDYWQADEEWWQKANFVGHDQVWAEGINYDDSAGVFSLDLALSLRRGDESEEIIGVIKGVLNVSPLLRSIPQTLPDEHSFRHVVMEDGRILVRLFGESPEPLQEKISIAFLDRIKNKSPGWSVDTISGSQKELIGYATIPMDQDGDSSLVMEGITPMFLLVHDQIDGVMRPVYGLLINMSLIGLLLVLGFGLAGLYIASRKIIAPLNVLKTAASSIADTARLTGYNPGAAPPSRRKADSMIRKVDHINTGDEIESLAGDFSLMARRVMNYHEQLEEELARKTEAIQEDLVLAREFQESLLPSEYPQIPEWNTPSSLSLEFFHFYKPTLSVGGDFFHIEKLSEHKASIFIADVTGHGARAALVTAILRTLVRELSTRADDPAHFLDLMNKQFYSIMPQRLDCIFATAFYLVLDVRERTAKFASAGHPSALLIDRSNCCVTPIIANGEGGPALGLMPKAAYRTFERNIQHRDAFLLVTDGIIEAPNAQGEEFGWERLMACTAKNYNQNISKIIMQVLDETNRFMDTEMAPDDLCMVAVEINEINRTGRPLGVGIR